MKSRKKPPKPLVPPPMKSLKRARDVTSKFHALTHRLEKLERASSSSLKKTSSHQPSTSSSAEATKIRRELNTLGGRQAYQEASALTTARHRTCKWVFSLLTKFGLRPMKGQRKPRLLEVGAVNTQLVGVPWLDVTAIDLQSRHPRIEQRDFFSLAPASDYDFVVCSMVLNCVPTAKDRGKMLAMMSAHLTPGGYCFIMV